MTRSDRDAPYTTWRRWSAAVCGLSACLSLTLGAQDTPKKGNGNGNGNGNGEAAALPFGPRKVEVYGFGQADIGHDFQRTNPAWFDVVRPTKLPSGPTEFNANGNAFVGARQSRFGAMAVVPTDNGDVLARFEFDMFGVGVDAGQTTIRLRLAYGQWGAFGAGQLWSPFMDNDVFPNILDYWGPSGMLYFRNVMAFWEPVKKGETSLRFALERPGASADGGAYAERISLANVRPRFPLPDLSGAYKYAGKYGYVRLAGIVRDIRWEQIPPDSFDISGRATGWGGTISSNIKFKSDVVRLQLVYGEGIQNYFNDAPVDVAVRNNFDDLRRPIEGVPLPIFGAVAYLDHAWNSKWSSSVGWSMTDIDNSDGQLPDAFRNGQYATANLLWTPVKNVMMGAEYQFSQRNNYSDGFSFDDHKIQFSFKYSFSQNIGGLP